MNAPVSPVPLPPGRLVNLPGRGEVFLRDSGGDGPAVLLLHGWMFQSDLNWWPVYGPLAEAGLRVLAIDHRGHGRGLRTREPFSLEACAGDAAALVRELDCGPVTVVGYSMGGPIAQLVARDHPTEVRGLVLCATAQEWQGLWMNVFWKTMGLTRLWLGLFPKGVWDLLLRSARVPEGPYRDWAVSELTRGSSLDMAEAGRELSRYDARLWIDDLGGLPSAVVVTTKDRSVPPHKQRALAEALGAETFDVRADHMAVSTHRKAFRAALLAALDSVGATEQHGLQAVAG